MKKYEELFNSKTGKFISDSKYKEIHKLDKLLTEASIPHTFSTFFDGWQVCYPTDKGRIMDAVEHFGSYGADDDLLEIMGLTEDTSDNIEGWLSAEEVFNRIQTHYKEHPYEK